jgi:hypothetical protein
LNRLQGNVSDFIEWPGVRLAKGYLRLDFSPVPARAREERMLVNDK